MPRLKQLDVVRGIAIILVLIWHYLPRVQTSTPKFILTFTNIFWSGVDLFFVLSGFLIATVLFNSVDSKNYYQVFYLRRAARILPLYLLLCFTFFIIKNLHISNLDASQSNPIPLWSYLTFTQNFLMAQQDALNSPWMAVTWSLAVEEQFYIFLSLLIKNSSKSFIVGTSFALIVIAPIARFFLHPIPAYVLPFTRVDSLMLGVLLALVWLNKSAQALVYKYAFIFCLSFIFLLFVVGMLTYNNIHPGDAFGHSWLGLFYLNFIILALMASSKITNLIFQNKLLEWFGLRSYGIYLLHIPIQISLTALLASFPTLRLYGGIIVLLDTLIVLGISELSYRYFEKPIIKLGRKFEYDCELSGNSELRQTRV